MDIDTWNKAVPLENDPVDFIEMAGQFLEPDVLKEDTQSISSSMNDSAYMSQPDMAQLQGALVNMQYQSTQAQGQPGVEGFVNPDVLSPALSSNSHGHGAYYNQQGDMNNFMLPPAARVSGQASLMTQFANPSSNQLFMDSPDSNASPFTTQTMDGQQMWSHDSHELFNAAMLASNNSLLRSQLNRPLSRAQTAVTPRMHRYSESGEQDNVQQSPSSSRPQGRRVTFRSCSTPSLSASGLNIGLGHDTRPETARRASSNTMHNLHNDLTLAASPTASVASHLGHYTTGAVHADAFSYIDYDGLVFLRRQYDHLMLTCPL